MQFKRPRKLSSNIEDRRGAGPQRGTRRSGAAAGGTVGVAGIVALLVAMCSGGGGGGLPGLDGAGFDSTSLGGSSGAGTTLEAPLGEDADPNRDAAELASVVLDNSQFYWTEVFAENDLQYQDATLVLFTGSTPTGCGQGSSQTGPFYCSLDNTIYIDLTFWDELESRFGASGDFAQAYVISHEVAHHVQNLLGISENVRNLRQQRPGDSNALSVRQELQADCFAGAWANSVWTDGDVGEPNGIEISETDIREALNAAAAVGDDRIQEATTGRVNPESWTHGSADQRMEWFTKGFETGDANECDTFS